MKPKYERVDEGFYRVYLGTQHIATLEKNPWFFVFRWQIYKANGEKVVQDNYDCFTWLEARRVISQYCKLLERVCEV